MMAGSATLRPADRKLIWRAGADQIEHAHEPKATRTLCNQPIVAERLAWPKRERHEVCDLLAKGCTWSEIRAMHGDA